MPITINGSGTITGISAGGLPDAIITTAEIVDANVTQAKLATAVLPLGAGQTWTDVTGSRALSTTYTNTTGRPIQVSVSGYTGGGTSGGAIYITAGGLTSFGSWAYSGAVPIGTSSIIVPAGASYYATPTGSVSLTYWIELR